MSEAKFKVGDRVRVIATGSSMFNDVGVITDIGKHVPLPYRVETECGEFSSWFRRHELEPAPVVKECLTVDNVNHPAHYNQGGIECLEAIKAALGDGFVAYLRGNVIKYIWRCKHKGGIEDLRKAAFYLDRAIKEMEVTSE